eukprot:144314-Amphidinium_carterae.1
MAKVHDAWTKSPKGVTGWQYFVAWKRDKESNGWTVLCRPAGQVDSTLSPGSATAATKVDHDLGDYALREVDYGTRPRVRVRRST